MRNLGKIVLHIPAREGSKRVPRKNMRNMNGKPMIAYSVETVLQANICDDVYINTDSVEIINYINEHYPSVKIYTRHPELANDQASSDQFNFDIINTLEPDTLIMINPVCPLLEAKDIKNALQEYKQNNCDTLITSESTQMQTFYENEPVNIDTNEQLAASQDNKRITILNWAVTIWDAHEFSKRMKEKGYAVLGNKRVFFDIEPINATKVSEEKDFIFASLLIKSLKL